VNGLKAIAKIGAIGAAAFLALWPTLPTLAPLVGMSPAAIPGKAAGILLHISIFSVGAFAVVAAFDWIYQRRHHENSLKMTKSEVKQEARQSEVAPEVRGAIRPPPG